MKIKRTIEILFIILASAAILGQAARILLDWRQNRLIQNEIRKGARVAVVKIIPRFPPALLLEFENSSRREIREVHFQLIFESNGQEVARGERDFGSVSAGATKLILLESLSVISSGRIPGPKTSLQYHLFVSPNSKKSLPEISGEFEIQ